MSWLYCLLPLIFSATSKKQVEVEHTPFHKRNAQHALVDVRDAYLTFTSSRVELDDTVAVSANTSTIGNGDRVEIRWSNKDAALLDMVAIYTPPSRGVQDYLDFRYITDTEGWAAGAGHFHETLFNMRGDYLLRYLAVDSQKRVTVKATYKISVRDNEPMQGHIGVTGQPGQMVVMWNSARMDNPRVQYSTSPSFTNVKSVPATSTTYSADELCGGRANTSSPIMYQHPGFFHSAVIQGLSPGVRYYYSYGTDKGTSDVTSFRGPPNPDTKVTQTTFIGYGDMGAYYPPYNGDSLGAAAVTHALEREVAQGKTDFILHFGDISYARGRGYIWDQFMTQMTNVASQVPYMVGVGNHEYDHVSGGEKDPSGAQEEGFHPDWGNYGDDGGGECGVPTMHRYITPKNGNKVFWYSFDYGLIHVIQFSSEHDFRPGSRQFEWLRQDLKSVNRTVTPWIVVTSHRAIYTSQDDMGDHVIGLHMRMHLEEMFYQYKVNLHLSGHYHSYESTCTVVSGDCVKPGTGTVYVVVGTAGYGLETQDYMPYPWSKHQQCDKFGYQRVSANTTHMHIQFVTVPHGLVADDITIPVWDEHHNTKWPGSKKGV